jgi:hypothetical protein
VGPKKKAIESLLVFNPLLSHSTCEPEIVNVSGAQESIPRYRFRQPMLDCRTGLPDYIGWRNRLLGSLNVYKYGLCFLNI